MDDDPVLRSLSADLERDDPELAALLSGAEPSAVSARKPRAAARHLRRLLVAVVLLAVLAAALLLPLRMVLALATMLLILGSPLAACWLLESSDGRTPRHP